MEQRAKVSEFSALLTLGQMAVLASVISAVLLFVARLGLQTPPVTLLTAIAIVSIVSLWPIAIANRATSGSGLFWSGPISLLLLLLSLVTVKAGGLAGAGLLILLGLAAIGYAVRRQFAVRCAEAQPLDTRIAWRRTALFASVVVGAGLLGFALGTTKYVSFLSDYLLVYGRNDGDVMFFDAIIHSIADFGRPSTGVSGLPTINYHIGMYAMAAALLDLSDGNAGFTLLVVQNVVLAPLASFAFVLGARIVAMRFLGRDGYAPANLGFSFVAFLLMPMLQISGWSNLALMSTSLLTGGVFASLLWPAVIALLPLPAARDNVVALRHPAAWLLAGMTVPIIAAGKISVAYVWVATLGYLALRLLGWRRAAFWLLGSLLALMLIGSIWLFAPIGSGAAEMLGRPYFVEYGFSEGDFLLPFTVQWVPLFAIIGFWLIARGGLDSARRIFLEAAVIAVVAGNLPGLLIHIPGGDAVFFIYSAAWLAMPIFVAVAATLPHWLRHQNWRWRGPILVALGALCVAVALDLKTGAIAQARIYIAGTALLRTGDMSYYADDRKRSFRADARRALEEHGFWALLRLPLAAPPTQPFVDLLRATKLRYGAAVAAYIPPQSDYWDLVPDCDGKSLWPMAVAALPLIDGTVPDQESCQQGFALAGLADVPAHRVGLQDAELCRLAASYGFEKVLKVGNMADTGSLLACEKPAAAKQEG